MGIKRESKTYKKYIEKLNYKSKYKFLKDSIGGVLTNRSGYLDVKKFLFLTKKYLQNKSLYIENNIKPKKLNQEKII